MTIKPYSHLGGDIGKKKGLIHRFLEANTKQLNKQGSDNVLASELQRGPYLTRFCISSWYPTGHHQAILVE